jgi:hypothetical protein
MTRRPAGRAGDFPECWTPGAQMIRWPNELAEKNQLSDGNEDFPGESADDSAQTVTTMKLWTGLLFSVRDLPWRRT